MPCRFSQPIDASCSARQRLGHQHVVVDRDDVRPEPAQQRRERRWSPSATRRRRTAPYGVADAHAGAVATSSAEDRGVLVDPHAERRGTRLRRPQASRAGSTSAHVGSRSARRGRSASATSARTCVAVEQLELVLAVPRAQLGGLAQLVDLPAAAVATSSSPVRSNSQSMPCASTASPDRVEVLLARAARASRARSGQRSSPLQKPWVRLAAQKPPLRPRRGPADGRASSSTTSRDGSSLLGQQRGPQPGVAAADDHQVGRRRSPTSAGGRRRPRRVGRARTASARRRPATRQVPAGRGSRRPVTPARGGAAGDELPDRPTSTSAIRNITCRSR